MYSILLLSKKFSNSIFSTDIVKVRLPSPTGWSTFSSDDMPEYGPEHKSIVAKLLTPNMYKTLSQAAIEAPEWTFSEAIKGTHKTFLLSYFILFFYYIYLILSTSSCLFYVIPFYMI